MIIERGGRAPAVPAALALCAGVALPARVAAALSPASAAGLLLAAVAVHIIVTTRRWRHRPNVSDRVRSAGSAPVAVSGAADALALAALLGAAAVHAHVRLDTVRPDDIVRSAVGRHAVVTGRVIESKERAGGGSRAVVAVDSIGSGTARSATGRVWVTLRDERAPARGARLRVRGRVFRPGARRNPGAFDFRRYLRSRSIHTTLSARSVETLCGPESPGDRARAAIEAALARRLDDGTAAVLRGLMLGSSDAMETEQVEAFRRSGTVHILAVSGLHVGLILLMAATVLRALRTPRRLSPLVPVLLLPLFIAVVGPRPSAVRASLVAGFFVVSGLVERKTSPVNTLALAAVVLLIVRPGSIDDLGFRLSFGAAASIVATFDAVRRRVPGAARTRAPALRWTADAIALSVAAQLGAAPALLWSFGRVSLVSPLANLAAVPLAGATLACGVLTAACDRTAPWLASRFAGAAWLSARGLVLVADRFARLPWADWCPGSSFALPAALVAVAVALSGRSGAGPRRTAWGAVGAAALLVVLSTAVGPGRSASRVTFYDVGQGDAALVELEGGYRALIDTGPRGPTGCSGRRVIAPHLARAGVTRIDDLLITHAHADHFGGAAAVLRAVGVGRVLLPPGRAGHPGLERTVEVAESLGVPIVEAARGDTLVRTAGGVVVLVWPGHRLPHDAGENDASLVARLQVGEESVLFTGDIEKESEAALVDSGAQIAAGVLKVAHHGSETSSTRAFLERSGPAVGVVSVGRGNRHGHPDTMVIRRLERLGVTVVRTDIDGAVVLDLRGTARTLRTIRTRRRLSWSDVAGDAAEGGRQSSSSGSGASSGPTATTEHAEGSRSRRAARSTSSSVKASRNRG